MNNNYVTIEDRKRIAAGLNVSCQSIGQFRLGGQPSANHIPRKRMTYRNGLPRSPTSSACVRTAFLFPHDHTLHSQWLHSHAQLCCDRLSPLGRPSCRRMSACRRSSLSMPLLRSRSCPRCLVSGPALRNHKRFPMERDHGECFRVTANVFFVFQRPFREPVCDSAPFLSRSSLRFSMALSIKPPATSDYTVVYAWDLLLLVLKQCPLPRSHIALNVFDINQPR